MPRVRLSWVIAGLTAPLWAHAQVAFQTEDASTSTEVHKCVRAGEVFYTNGKCPGGTSEARLGEPARAVAPRVRTVPMRNARDTAAPAVPADDGFKPLSSFPPLPESEAPTRRSAARVDEAPVRAPIKYVAEAAPDAKADNHAACAFVAAELDRLQAEGAAAGGDDAKNRLATHQQRLKARQTQLKC